jgi:Kef-type K+ transport system membrane component KefB/nucleotide-binding universal stress UspA family protein
MLALENRFFPPRERGPRLIRLAGVLFLGGFAAAVLVMPALAAEHKAGPSEAGLIGQIVLLIVAGRLLGEGMLRVGQPAVMGQLLAGILLGPSVLGALWPDAQQFLFPKSPEQKAMIDGLAQFGILMLLLLAGMETELALVRTVRRAAISASVAGITLPFICGFLLGQFLPEQLLPEPDRRLVTSLFLGTALSISSVKIVASVVRDMGFLRRNVGQIILAAAIVDDTIGWIIIAITLGLAGQDSFSWLAVGQSVFGTLLFLVFSFTFGRRLVFKLIQWSNDYFRGEAPVIATILVVMGTFALITHLLGVHSVLGAFVAGILVGESPMLTKEIDRQLRGLVAGLFMPVFFGLAGLNSDLSILKNAELAVLTVGLVAIASFGKATGAFIGGWFGGLTGKESMALAMGMNARGSTEVIVATIGLSMGVLSQNLFTMIVAMAFITTTAMPPTLRWALHRLPIRKEERHRLDREEFEQRAFVPKLERLLVAVDGSANGRFASRVAGLLAGSRGIPVTVLSIENGISKQLPPKDSVEDERKGSSKTADAVEIVTAAAETAGSRDETAPRIDVIQRQHDVPSDAAIAEEARRGYDLLVVGVEPTVAARGSFHGSVSKLVRDFEGSIAIVVARGHHATDPIGSPLNILTPVTGNENSRRGAEIAVTLAEAAKTVAAALSVISRGAKNRQQRRREADALAQEVKQIAEHHATKVQTTVRIDVSVGDAILQSVDRGKHDLIVIGVSRRPGDALSFGDVATALLNDAKCSLLFIAPHARTTGKSSARGPQKPAAAA